MKLFQIRISLLKVVPTVWRRFMFPGNGTLTELHAVVQAVMGWQNAHAHQFRIAGAQYSDPQFELGDEVLNERHAILERLVATQGDRLEYVYDFGDFWEHELVVEEVSISDRRQDYHPICLTGARACPPEDCGGPDGYGELLEALADVRHPQHREMRAWAGGRFDPESFDVEAVNRRLRKLQTSRRGSHPSPHPTKS